MRQILKSLQRRIPATVVLGIILLLSPSQAVPEDGYGDIPALSRQLNKMIGPRDGVIISGPDSQIIFKKNAEQELIPASILKVLTSAASIHMLGATYRFKTEFYLSPRGDLIIKGYGDPLLISEQIERIAEQLACHVDKVADLVLDASYFSQPIRIPGRSHSSEPYDAPNGALSVNFNTVNFKREQGKWVSGEPQTPLLPFVIPAIEDSGLSSGRITLAANSRDGLLYAGEMFRFFLSQEGVDIHGNIRFGLMNPTDDRLIRTHNSDYPLTEVVENLLEYSNNFIANQLVLALGAHQYGPPADLEKGMKVLMDYCVHELGMKNPRLVEGSGLARENRVTAREMMTVLDKFYLYCQLMRHEGRVFYKTGSLKGISSRAGYLSSRLGGHYRFVVILNSEGKGADAVMSVIERYLK